MHLSRLLPAIAVAGLLAAVMSQAANAQTSAYIRSNTGEPWDLPDSPNAMNDAFGTGNWASNYYQTTNVNNLFSGATKFIYMEGGNGTDVYLKNFLNTGTNRTLLENWVASGGSLFLNAADWGNVPGPGFGVTFTGNQFSTTGTAVDPTHAIFTGAGLYGNAGTAWTGNYFAHDTVSGAGLTNYINGQFGSVLSGKSYGSGHVLMGGMTSPFFQNPDPQAYNLRVNTLQWGAQQANIALTPESSGIANMAGALFVPGIGGLMALRARRRKAKAAA